MKLSSREIEKLTMTIPDMVSNARASTRVANALKNERLMFTAQLLAYTPEDLRRLPNVGNTVYRDIVRVITSHGFRVGALQEYKNDLLWGAPSVCGELMKTALHAQRYDVVDMNVIKARQAFGVHLLSIEERCERPNLYCNTRDVSGWLDDCLTHALQYVPGLTAEFLKSVFTQPMDVGNVGLKLPFNSKGAETGLRLS